MYFISNGNKRNSILFISVKIAQPGLKSKRTAGTLAGAAFLQAAVQAPTALGKEWSASSQTNGRPYRF